MQTISQQLASNKIIPVVQVEQREQALGLAAAILDGGISVIEITLRSNYGVQAIRDIKQQYPEMLVLAGTVLTCEQFDKVHEAGADGVITPGLNETLLKYALDNNIPLLPGVATASELMLGIEYGYTEFKLFPAVAVGGIDLLKAFYAPFPNVSFCPTGGVTSDNAQSFLSLPNVLCVGGSWIANNKLIAKGDWSNISQLCREAVELA